MESQRKLGKKLPDSRRDSKPEEFPRPHGAEREQEFIDFPAEMRGQKKEGEKR
jgi:hypothetical protein